eukprot:995598-Prymnesium_polylepis.1
MAAPFRPRVGFCIFGSDCVCEPGANAVGSVRSAVGAPREWAWGHPPVRFRVTCRAARSSRARSALALCGCALMHRDRTAGTSNKANRTQNNVNDDYVNVSAQTP